MTGESPALLVAARSGSLSIVDLLPAAGAESRITTADNTTVLILMVAVKMFPFNLERLLAAGANPDAVSKNGWTA